MTDTSTGWVIVDDRDPGIAYGAPPGAILWLGGVSQEYDQTTTGLDAGDTATYYFNASAIGVFGTYGPTGNSGPPVAVYQVDNTPATTVTAPTAQVTLYRQTFWTSPQLSSLAPGAFHKLVITATAPNHTLWLDYLAYPPTNQQSATSTSNPAGPSSSSNATSSNNPSLSAISTFSTTTVTLSSGGTTPTTTAVGQSVSGTSAMKKNMVAIAVGTAIGTVAFILVISALVYVRRKKSRPPAGGYLTVQSILPGTRSVTPREAISSPDMFEHTTLAPTVTPQRPPSENSPSYHSNAPQQEDPRDQLPRPLPPVPIRASDGGVRLMGGPLEIPPEYQEHY